MSKTTRTSASAWLEAASGEHFPLFATNSLGRSSKNSIVLAGDMVSRRHALIQAQDMDEYWLVDLGSCNGTRLNERRVIQPTRLQNADVIEIAGQSYRFQQHGTRRGKDVMQTQAATTARELRSGPCWLLITDIRGFTELSRTMSPDSLAQLVGSWLGTCNAVIQSKRGIINKYLGDGLLAYWSEGEKAGGEVLNVLGELKELQSKGNPSFRTVLHYGSITIGGASATGEENLLGNEVNFLFRMEEVCAKLKLDCLLSEAAGQKLPSQDRVFQLPSHPVRGFEGMHNFYTI